MVLLLCRFWAGVRVVEAAAPPRDDYCGSRWQLAIELAAARVVHVPEHLLRRRNCCSLGAMRADHPGSYLHLSQPMRLDARPSTYMWPRKQHDVALGDG